MTDAAVSVTQSAVEEFTERYLRSLGCSIERSDDHWVVSVPDSSDTEIPHGKHTLVRGEGTPDDDDDSTKRLYPESAFFQRLLREAGERSPTGKLSIESESGIETPEWIQHSTVEVQGAQFTPYYDRTAVVVLFRVGIETVSEYQQAFLRAVAVDARSEEHLPRLAGSFLELTSIGSDEASGGNAQLTQTEARPLLDTAREQVLSDIQDRVDEIHREASRAADSEVEEYRQLQEQRIEELQEEYSDLSSKISDLSEQINTGDEDSRVQALRERKRLKSEYEELDETLNELRERRDSGFPKRQREIRERHSLDVQVTPLTLTEVEYERGEIDFELTDGSIHQTITLGYGSGIGVADTVRCSSCERELTEGNPLQTISDGLECQSCTKER
jgi:archaellum component FlaC